MKELKGLEILIMLASNWDNKDGTSGPGYANTGIFERVVQGRRQLIYSFTDWGSGVGFWGDKTGQRLGLQGLTKQTSEFVKGVAKGRCCSVVRGTTMTASRPMSGRWMSPG